MMKLFNRGKHSDERQTTEHFWVERRSWLSRLREKSARLWTSKMRRRTRRLLGWMVYVVLWPYHQLVSFTEFSVRLTIRWWEHGRLRQLLCGAPFLMVATVFGFLVIAANLRHKSALATIYSDVANRAQSDGRLGAAVLYYERLIQLRGRDNESLFRLAMAAHDVNDMERFDAVIRAVAPFERTVYAPAHLWRARSILARGSLSETDVKDAQSQLLRVIELDPTNVEAHGFLGEIYAQLGRWEDSCQHLQFAVRNDPNRLLRLAKVSVMLNKKDIALLLGQQARDHFRKRVASDSSDIRAYMQWADAAVFLERFTEAVGVLRDLQRAHDSPEVRRALAKVHVTWSDTLGAVEPVDRSRQFQVLQDGVLADPTELQLFDRLMSLLRNEDSTAETIRQFLVENIANGRALLISHLILGTFEGERGNVRAAVQHLELANRIDASAPIVANNLAWFLSQIDPAQPERGLTLANAIVEKWPSNADLRDTRGQIFVKLGRWQDAVSDLEFVVANAPRNPSTHRALAVAYGKLGMTILAQEHKKLAETK